MAIVHLNVGWPVSCLYRTSVPTCTYLPTYVLSTYVLMASQLPVGFVSPLVAEGTCQNKWHRYV